VRQAFRNAEALKLRAVESADAAVGANPEQAARVDDDAMDAVIGQPVCSGVGADRQLVREATTRTIATVNESRNLMVSPRAVVRGTALHFQTDITGAILEW